MGKILDRWREKDDFSDAEKELGYGLGLLMVKTSLDRKEARPLATTVLAEVGRQPAALDLTKIEKEGALSWILERLSPSLEGQVLKALLSGQPLHTIPLYHLYVSEDRRKREESARNRQISDDWENLAKNGFTFKVDGFKVQLVAEPDVKIGPGDDVFSLKGVLPDGRHAITRIDFRGLKPWIQLINREAVAFATQYGVEAKTLRIPLGVSLFFHAVAAPGVSLGELGRDLRILPERSIPLILECRR